MRAIIAAKTRYQFCRGAMSFSDFHGPIDDDKSYAILNGCCDRITHIDTFECFTGWGRSEQRIGAYLAKQGKQAQDFTIATKAGIASKEDGTDIFDNSLAHLESELDKSPQRLGVEQVEFALRAPPDAGVPIEEVAESLATLVKKGKTRQIGFSEIAPTLP